MNYLNDHFQMKNNNLVLLFLFVLIGNFEANRELPDACLGLIVDRNQWGARTALEVNYIIIPVKNVIVHHTVTDSCDTKADCTDIVTSIQNFHMENSEFADIGYNFLIGGDGKVYEGVGWHKEGAHTYRWNKNSIGIAFIGTFTNKRPNEKQLNAAHQLLECGVESGELDKNYRLFGGRQIISTESPGLKLYTEIKTWPHYSRTTSN